MMKRLILICAPLLAALFQSCSGGSVKNAQTDTVFTTTCYTAIDGRDTATLRLKTYDQGVKGMLLIKYYQKDKNEGYIEGRFQGDTLRVDYGFQVGNKKTWFKNPLAFLKKDKQLIMGVGQMQTTWGRTYFVKGVPIEFGKGRFTFVPVDCQ